MKAKKLWILLALLALVCGICAIQFRTNLVASEKVTIRTDTKAEVNDKGVHPTDGEAEQLRDHITSLEARNKKLLRRIWIGKIPTGYGTMPGLRGSLVGLPCVRIKIEDLPLDAVRYGLTKKNIRDAVEAQFRRHNIETLNYDVSPSDFSRKQMFFYRKTNNKPQLHIEVKCSASKGGLYQGYIEVSMKQNWSTEYPPEVPEGFKEEGASALQESAIFHQYPTEWTRRCFVYVGKLGTFVEDEKNALEELVDEFIDDYLAANPKGFVTFIRGHVGTEDDPVIPWAVIRGQVVHQGDTVDGTKVVKIHPFKHNADGTMIESKVEFEKDGKRWMQEQEEPPAPEWQ